MRVLLVEDNEINQQIAVELIEGVGASVRVAANGKVALETLTQGPVPPPFDAILMDLQMPVMDGFQATAAIRRDDRLASVPIIAMTAHATLEERQRCIDAGMRDHVSKPIDPRQLFETLARFHAGEAGARPAMPVAPPASVPHVEGLDTADGLRRVAGNERLYLKLLRQFMEDQARVPEEIRSKLATNEREGAERLAHTLKAVSGSLGAKSVQRAAEVVERLIRGQSAAGEIEAAIQTVQASLEPLLSRLREALPPPSETAHAPVDEGRAREAVLELRRLLADYDADAIGYIENNQGALHAVFEKDAWAPFMKSAQAFAFQDALALLEDAASSKGIALA
jgi:two-component system sensor histidine kinase/response regulator